MSNDSWQGPTPPKPPVPKIKVTQEQIFRICKLRKKVGWGALPLKHIFKFDVSESTYKRIIKANGLSLGSKIENKRIHVSFGVDCPDGALISTNWITFHIAEFSCVWDAS